MSYAVIHRAKSNIQPSGDGYFISESPPWLLFLADGLGSGNKARHAADIATALAREYCRDPDVKRMQMLPDLLTLCHKKLKNSRGAALGSVVLDKEQINFCGVGNIRLLIAGKTQKLLCSQPGIAGAQIPKRLTVKTVSTKNFTTGFIFSDGISLRSVLRTAEHPFRPLKVLAEEIDMLNGNTDDSTVIVFELNNWTGEPNGNE